MTIDSLKSSNLGRIACLRFSLGRTFCAVFLWRKKSTEMTDLGRFERALTQRNPPNRKLWCTPPAVLRLCSSKGLVRDALQKAPAQKTPSAPNSTLAGVYPCSCSATFFYAGTVHLPPCGWLCQCARPEIALCSARNSLSYPRTRNSLK